jgi:hypothetical protein
MVDLLCDVRGVLSDPTKWTTEEYARDSAGNEVDPSDKAAVCWCGQGAIYACGVAYGMPSLEEVIRTEAADCTGWAEPICKALDSIAARLGYRGFVQANDEGGREVALQVLESAIADLVTAGRSERRRPLRMGRTGGPRRPR